MRLRIYFRIMLCRRSKACGTGHSVYTKHPFVAPMSSVLLVCVLVAIDRRTWYGDCNANDDGVMNRRSVTDHLRARAPCARVYKTDQLQYLFSVPVTSKQKQKTKKRERTWQNNRAKNTIIFMHAYRWIHGPIALGPVTETAWKTTLFILIAQWLRVLPFFFYFFSRLTKNILKFHSSIRFLWSVRQYKFG